MTSPRPDGFGLRRVYGLTNRVELAFPWEAAAIGDQGRITDFSVDARIRLYDPLQDTGRWVRSLVRVFYQFNFNHPTNAGNLNLPWIGGNLVTTLGDPVGSHASIDIGAFTDTALAHPRVAYQSLGIGYIHRLTPELRVGAEYYHEIALSQIDSGGRRFFVGPDVAFAPGQVLGDVWVCSFS